MHAPSITKPQCTYGVLTSSCRLQVAQLSRDFNVYIPDLVFLGKSYGGYVGYRMAGEDGGGNGGDRSHDEVELLNEILALHGSFANV
ncbi:hypothetical protein QVD17_11164 [Tagetes erecta]|uniref:Uncharacterized protein n=1 Tax=Tagetes erecta TaxID=13708 RepID=A0AAD8L4S1_TARER|nr:hypothetical protein QVD17_11164 [Tagetes erecta]